MVEEGLNMLDLLLMVLALINPLRKYLFMEDSRAPIEDHFVRISMIQS